MKKIVGIAAAALLGATTLMSPGSLAQPAMNHGATPMTADHALRDGEVRKIDKETGKITIKHGPIKHLDMPPMSMVFTAKDRTLLDKVKAGDKIRFMAVDEGGKLVVTDIQLAK